MSQLQGSVTTVAAPERVRWIRDWPHWAPYAAVIWSLFYATLGVYWAVSGQGFPFTSESGTISTGSMVGRFGPAFAWIIVIAAGIPAAIMGTLMLRGVRRPRLFFISAGALLSGVLLLFMIEFSLLIQLAYIPFVVFELLTGAQFGQIYLQEILQSKWTLAYQMLCLIGGFLWLAATVSYARRSGDACLYCGRREGSEGWTSPERAAHWGRIAVYVGMIVPVIYGITRYAWAVGIPLGMSEEYWRQGQQTGMWTSGLFLATFGLVGAVLTLGLIQRWGEVFPRWIPGLSGRPVPIALAVVPASLVSVLLMVGGISLWSSYAQMVDATAATSQEMAIVVGPVLLFPIWSIALAVATLGYYYRRRGACKVCGLGASGDA